MSYHFSEMIEDLYIAVAGVNEDEGDSETGTRFTASILIASERGVEERAYLKLQAFKEGRKFGTPHIKPISELFACRDSTDVLWLMIEMMDEARKPL